LQALAHSLAHSLTHSLTQAEPYFPAALLGAPWRTPGRTVVVGYPAHAG